MFYIDNDSGVTVMPPVSAQRSAIVRWFSEGDGNNVITWPGMDWFNIVQAELLNTLEEAGIQPDKTKLNQLALSIKAIMNKNALLIKNNLSEIKTAGASAQRTARENLGIYDASVSKKGLVQLSSATNSTSEALAATPKAVKAANDNANSRLAKNQNGADIQDKQAFLDNVGVTSLTFMKNNGEMPPDANLNTFGPVKAYVGIWYKSTSTNATTAKNFPEDGAVGVLEVFNGGNFAGTQRFTTRDGNVYIRRLANKWNGSDGPWGIWRHTQSATRPLSTTIDLNTLGAAEHLGLWRNSSSAIASYERNYPEEGGFAQGMLEILEGGNYGRTQRYTTRRGNMYVRCLAASWDASNPQWEPWLRVGHQSESRYYEGDLNVLTDPGIYSVTGKATNGPMLDAAGATLLGILEVIRRFDGVSVWQRYTTTGKSETTQGRTFERVYAGSKWTEWREVYNSFSLPLNLGIGGAVAKLTSLDWQTHDFVPGSLITVRLDNMTNIPDGMDWGVIDGNLINIAVGPSDDSGTGRSMHVWRSTVSKANYRFFMVRISGNPGSRTITTRRVPIIDEAQTWGAKQTFSAGLSGELSGNASTATKLKTARKINSVSFDGSKDINLTPEDIDALPITGGTLTGGLTVDGEIVSKSGNGFRIVQGNYGFFIRNDGSNTYFMLTNSGDSLGTWSSLRPFAINNANGAVSIGNGLNVTGDTVSSSRVRAGNGKKFSISSSNSSTKEATFNLWGNSSRPVVAELGDDSGWHFYSQRNTDNSITFAVNGQISPSDYSNFDSRYVKDVRLGSQQYYGVNNWQTWNFQCPSGHVLSGINVQDTGSNSADNIAGVYYRPVQKYINGTWYNVASV
ncbi:TPA: tail fiber protein [Escherichia coli]|uniref:phage tail fiber protein n=4 Tax=Escherichia coli TaxID=562 RepID=UPI0017680F03|nr:tail fiber protein [Escherichia coli]EEW2258468.1 phage tail protein [Escherichia coli]EFF3146782.1 phage tail protein [Escherichia coli]EGH9952173.1 phage tail protein [Escherichia coli]EHH7636887.1 phage tail protein [Escherichia coli]EHI1001550.1 phage tail protein [Escherichia coli]